MKTLDELAIQYGTDKSSLNHHYTEIYERHFAPLRNESFYLLEIGIGTGASLKMWRDYFPRAEIYGIDSNPEIVAAAQTMGFRVCLCNQHIPSDLDLLGRKCLPQFTIIIDDGSHDPSDQFLTFMTLWSTLSPGGWYCIEDICSVYQIPGESINARITALALDLEVTDPEKPKLLSGVHLYHNLTLIKKAGGS